MKNQELTKAAEEVTAEVLKDYLKAANLVAHLTEIEIEQFISVAQAYGLNPFKREIYASKYGDNFSIVVGYETYIKRAERSGRLDGWEVKTEGRVDWNNPKQSSLKAVITIYRDDFKHPFIHEVYFSEYVQFNRSGQITKFWKDKPVTMVKKVVMSQGFRLCFSDELGGIPYTKEELGEDASFEILETTKPKEKEEPQKIEEKVEPPQYEELSPKQEFDHREQSIKAMVDACQSREDLKGVFNAYPAFKNLPEFLAIIKSGTDRVDGIEEAEIVEEEKEGVEEISYDKDKDEFPPLFPSENYDAKEAIRYVRKFEDADALAEFTINDNRKTVLEVVSQKLNSLNNEE